MKIAVVSTPVFRLCSPQGVLGYGGLEPLAWHIAAGLARLGHKVSLIAPDGSECPGVEIIQCGPERMVNEEQAYSGFPEIKNGWQSVRPEHKGYWQHLLQQDVIIDHSWHKNSYLLKQEGRLKVPVLGVCHAPVDTMFQKLPAGVDKPCFVCISEDQRNHFEALFNHPARTAYNGIDTNYYYPLNIPRSDRFLFLARFSTIKGPDIAIESCLKAWVGLDLIGDTTITNEPELLERCKAMAEQESPGWNREEKGRQIRLIGNCNRGECVWWYSQAKCLLHANKRFREPFGLSIIEAAACGCPTIAFDNGALRETVIDGQTGLLVKNEEEFMDAVTKMNSHRSVTYPECVDQASKFSIDNMVRRYAELCQEAIKTGGW